MSTFNPNNPYDIELAKAAGAGVQSSNQVDGIFTLYVWGTHAGTSKLQVSPDCGVTWLDYFGAAFTADGALAPVYLSRGEYCRLLSGGSSINAKLSPVR